MTIETRFLDPTEGLQISNYTGICQFPFLQQNLFPDTGGYINGRYCAVVPNPGGHENCCVPCPVANWKYGDELMAKTKIPSYISALIFPFVVLLLLSYAVLPAKYSHLHYLSVSFTIGICCMHVAFIIPLGAKPEQCYNEITPKGMHDDLSCAFTGSLLLFGGFKVVVWSFIRAIAFHLQVCWEQVLGTKFMWGALICGWGVPAIGTTVMLIVTGVSFRFGEICHINMENSMYDYWIPALVFAGTALVLQLSTMAYCIRVYLKSLFNREPSAATDALPSYAASVRSINARQAYRRISKVFRLQWRGVAFVFIIIANTLLYSTVFISLDATTKLTHEVVQKAFPWLLCLSFTKGDKEHCKDYAVDIGPDKDTLLAVLMFLSMVGLWNVALFARPSMFTGWLVLFRNAFSNHKKYVSADARTLLATSPEPHSFEMLYKSNTTSTNSKTLGNKTPTPQNPLSPQSPSSYDWESDKEYIKRPPMSFSRPHPTVASPPPRIWSPVSRASGMISPTGLGWGPRETFAAPSRGRNPGVEGV
ncbi:protein gprM [Aspergillus glaucus CBS 516.65]|uniref:G-protein coupled receptors family 2 profile 2 domain-containing protein n=1 Tax=Aspergillus glaucus CBS 516.65 TaxID=1160497 RepID=A0A1L9V9S9_ASPGL|nr:hypothetical protein ASPGLDRAFT_76754 [Aspergillus glaucus CBS 516.65]OJJ80706.1 hypothetical protein ASPGLDRAFT_76754 [Aspergillus glaucus CBS 516.65]